MARLSLWRILRGWKSLIPTDWWPVVWRGVLQEWESGPVEWWWAVGWQEQWWAACWEEGSVAAWQWWAAEKEDEGGQVKWRPVAWPETPSS